MENMPPHNADGASAMHMYMPWWLYKKQAKGQLDFARGYHIEFGGGMTPYATEAATSALSKP